MKHLIILFTAAFMAVNIAAEAPERIISLAPSATYDLYMLGLENSVIGITRYCPKGTVKKEIVGTILEPNIELIVSLKPDLVVMTKEINIRNTYEKLKKFGINCYLIENDNNYKDICTHFAAFAERLGRKTAAEKIISSANDKIAAVSKKIRNAQKQRVFWEVGQKPLYTVGKGSFVDDYNAYVGCTNIFADLDLRFPRVSREEIIKRDPDIILIAEKSDITISERRLWDKYGSLKAVKSGKIFLLENKEMFVPNPLNFAEGVEKVAKLIHPDKFNE